MLPRTICAVINPLQGVPYVAEVDSVIDLPGGINVPMVVRTTDCYGNTQKQLVKSGNDDLRQDAVMQQFFGLINDLLSSSAESQQRQLSLRTYRWA
jgi:ataxia telangiectasia mutated family protein